MIFCVSQEVKLGYIVCYKSQAKYIILSQMTRLYIYPWENVGFSFLILSASQLNVV